MQKSFDYEGARKAGYSDSEIQEYLGQSSAPSQSGFDYEGARKAGYSDQEIREHLAQSSSQKPERGIAAKGARIAGQFATSAAEAAILPYEIAQAPLSSKNAQNAAYRENLHEDIERLREQKASGIWDQQDQELYDSLVNQSQNPQESEKFLKEENLTGVRGFVELAGVDMHPEGIGEKAASWLGFIKNPTKVWSWLKNPKSIKDFAKLGLSNPKEFIKKLSPGTDELRALTAGTALELAEQGGFGPIGTIASAVLGDIAGFGPKAFYNLAKNPKKYAAQAVNLVTRSNSKKSWQKQLLSDAEKAGIQLDAGTITDSNVVKWLQARAIQSGLTGDALENFKKSLSDQIINGYEGIARETGDLIFENNHQASQALNDYLKNEANTIDLSIPKNQKGQLIEGRVDLEEIIPYEENLLNSVAPQEFANDIQAGETLRETAQNIKRPIQEQFNERWEAFNQSVGDLPVGPQGQLGRELMQFVEDHEGSLLMGTSSAEYGVVNAARQLAEAILVAGGEIGITARRLLKTKRTLQDVANWEFGGSNFESAYKHLTGLVDSAVERAISEVNPALLEGYQALKQEYSQFKQVFENKNVLPLFEPNNHNYSNIFNSFLKPDRLQSLEGILSLSPEGEALLRQVKRDYAQEAVRGGNASDRDIRNLLEILGPEFQEPLEEYIHQRNYAREHPRGVPNRVETTRELPLNNIPSSGRSLAGRVSETQSSSRRKLYDYLKDKTPEQVMKEMNTVSGVKNLRRVLELTPEGRKLFKDLSRFKLEEIIAKSLKEGGTQQIKLGTFSGLLKTRENKALALELLGPESYKRLRLLQKNAGRLAESADRFFNASKSGTVASDIGAVTSAMYGIFTLNPYVALPAIATIGGLRVVSKLFSDKQFLKYLSEYAAAPNSSIGKSAYKKLLPIVKKATEYETVQEANG